MKRIVYFRKTGKDNPHGPIETLVCNITKTEDETMFLWGQYGIKPEMVIATEDIERLKLVLDEPQKRKNTNKNIASLKIENK